MGTAHAPLHPRPLPSAPSSSATHHGLVPVSDHASTRICMHIYNHATIHLPDTYLFYIGYLLYISIYAITIIIAFLLLALPTIISEIYKHILHFTCSYCLGDFNKEVRTTYLYLLFGAPCIYRVSKKMWKNVHNYLQTHPQCKSWL